MGASLRWPIVALVLLAATPAAQQAPPLSVDRMGPQTGERVPDWSGSDQFGRSQTLTSVMRERGAMLVFFRSADW